MRQLETRDKHWHPHAPVHWTALTNGKTLVASNHHLRTANQTGIVSNFDKRPVMGSASLPNQETLRSFPHIGQPICNVRAPSTSTGLAINARWPTNDPSCQHNQKPTTLHKQKWQTYNNRRARQSKTKCAGCSFQVQQSDATRNADLKSNRR